MARIDKRLQQLCLNHPDAPRHVVITLGERHQHMQADDLGCAGVRPIPGMRGMFCGEIAGRDLLELANRSEVDAIEEDIEASTLSPD